MSKIETTKYARSSRMNMEALDQLFRAFTVAVGVFVMVAAGGYIATSVFMEAEMLRVTLVTFPIGFIGGLISFLFALIVQRWDA